MEQQLCCLHCKMLDDKGSMYRGTAFLLVTGALGRKKHKEFFKLISTPLLCCWTTLLQSHISHCPSDLLAFTVLLTFFNTVNLRVNFQFIVVVPGIAVKWWSLATICTNYFLGNSLLPAYCSSTIVKSSNSVLADNLNSVECQKYTNADIIIPSKIILSNNISIPQRTSIVPG